MDSRLSLSTNCQEHWNTCPECCHGSCSQIYRMKYQQKQSGPSTAHAVSCTPGWRPDMPKAYEDIRIHMQHASSQASSQASCAHTEHTRCSITADSGYLIRLTCPPCQTGRSHCGTRPCAAGAIATSLSPADHMRRQAVQSQCLEGSRQSVGLQKAVALAAAAALKSGNDG